MVLKWLMDNPGVTMRCEVIDMRDKVWPCEITYNGGLFHFEDGENKNSLPLAAVMLRMRVREAQTTERNLVMKIPSEGCWKAAAGCIYRHSESTTSNFAFQVWFNGAWCEEFMPGTGPWTPCPDPSVPEWRDAYLSKEWALENRDKVLETEYGTLWRFSTDCLQYEQYNRSGRWVPFEGFASVSSRPKKGTW